VNTEKTPWSVQRKVELNGDITVAADVIPGDLSQVSAIDKTEDGVPIVGLRSPEDLAAAGGVPDGFELIYYKPNTWPIQTRDPLFGDGDTARTIIARQVKGTFRAQPSALVAGRDLLLELRSRSPRKKMYKHRVKAKEPKSMLEISIPDLHLGLNVWQQRGGNGTYNFDVAERLFLASIETLLARAKHHNVERIVFPIGNDFLHVDNRQQATTNGTPQGGESADWQQSFLRGRDLLFAGIDRLKKVAPIHVVVVPGNHDADSMFHMGLVVEAYYNNDENVTVDAGPSTTKFVEYGSNLIGFDHGNNIKPLVLAGVMAERQPEAWQRTKFRAWHLGHNHRKGVYFSENAVDIEFLPSLAGVNAWHLNNAYVWSRAATAFVWGHDEGQIARYQVNVDPTNPEGLLG